MKKLLSIILVIALVFGLSAVTALADTVYSGEVHGVITNDDTGKITGSVTGAYNLTITGQIYAFAGHYAQFTGAVSGDFSGEITSGLYCKNGYDSMYAEVIVGETAIYILGGFPQSGIKGDFKGEITMTKPANVTSLMIQSASTTMDAGGTMQMTAAITPSDSYDVLWSVWMDGIDVKDYAWIGQDGVLHALKAGTVTVIANTLDPTLATTTKNITIENPDTEVLADVDPTYTIVIPASVDFGTLVKDSGKVARDFDVSAEGVIIEDDARIDVDVTTISLMSDGHGNTLAYSLYNAASGGDALTPGAQFASFTATGTDTQNGRVEVDTAAITTAGSYKGTMVFTITYEQP